MQLNVTDTYADSPGEQTALFVIWANGRHREREIIHDICERFDVLDVFEVRWSPEKVAENFQRFYADIDVRGIYHRFSKGPGPFIAITLVDRSPVVEERMTSRGLRVVNGRFLDAKNLYREWAGELVVHCTENAWETDRDVFMLLGKGISEHRQGVTQPWSGNITKVSRDLTGANGWASEAELFGALNRAVEYVLVTGPAKKPYLTKTGDVNLLAADGRALHTVLRARPGEPAPDGGSFRVQLADRQVAIGLRHPGDGFFPVAFARRLLQSRRLSPGGVFRPGVPEVFLGLAYHELTHKPVADQSDLESLLDIVDQSESAGWSRPTVAGMQALQSLLSAELAKDNESFVRPRDARVYFNRSVDGLEPSWSSDLAAAITRHYYRLHQSVRYSLHNLYWRTRDSLLIAAPGIRVIKRWITG